MLGYLRLLFESEEETFRGDVVASNAVITQIPNPYRVSMETGSIPEVPIVSFHYIIQSGGRKIDLYDVRHMPLGSEVEIGIRKGRILGFHYKMQPEIKRIVPATSS